MENNEKIISCLNSLIETCKDGELGYRTASEDVKDPSLKELFSEFAKQRSGFVTQLKAEVKALGGDPEASGSVIGTLHRGWINLKGAISTGDREAILAECEKGDSYAESDYDKAKKESLPASATALVKLQHDAVKMTRDRIRGLIAVE